MAERHPRLPFTEHALTAHSCAISSKGQSHSARKKKAMQVRLDMSTTALETSCEDRDVSQGSDWKLDVGIARRPLSLISLAGLPMPKCELA